MYSYILRLLFFFRLAGGSTELSSDLATHCVLELPAESGDLPNGLVDLDVISGVLSKIGKICFKKSEKPLKRRFITMFCNL